jgi:hypothetical protein
LSQTENNVQSENRARPTLRLYADFPEDWGRFDAKTREDIGAFLEHLQENPFDPSIIEKSEKHGEYYATRSGSVIVYWKLARRAGLTQSELASPDAIHILAVAPADLR